MAVYVDRIRLYPNAVLRHKKWCHMIADSIKELHEMAELINLRTGYAQYKNGLVHYDLTPSKRELAIRKGAIMLGREAFIKKIQEVRTK